MNKLSLFIIFCILFIIPARAIVPPDSCNTVLWAVINMKGDTSYLLGTFHEFGNVFVDSYYPINATYNRADHIAVESLPVKGNKLPKVTGNWVKHLSRQQKKAISAYLIRTSSAYKLKYFRHMPASLLCYVIEEEMAMRECYIKEEKDVVGMDAYIMNGAITRKKKLTGLEDAAGSRLNVLNIMAGAKGNDDPAAVNKLMDMINNENKYRDTIRTQCWEADNYRNLTLNYHFSKQSVEDDINFPVFLDERNDAWMPKIKDMIDNDKAFIAVGLKHLYYQKGLIMQLINSGYTVIPIPMHKTGVVYRSPSKKK